MTTLSRNLISGFAALFITMTATAAAAPAPASAPASAQQVTIDDAWARATVPQQRAGGLFMQLKAHQDMKLIKVESEASAHTEIHEMVNDGDIMKMREVKSIPLAAGQTVALKPGGLHVMLIDLKQQLKAGTTVPLTLTFEDTQGQQSISRLDVQVRALNSAATPAQTPDHAKAHSHH